ncbi:response regulator transcription factor [Massilibacterium senegalense]|uniref:response regulator transcription factor n=1 Tax=Massilibacterium senegalense TaxID=1632858 RepID=UPI000785EF15|nr:response regulator transcription factor [Massilibacterium senegalense]
MDKVVIIDDCQLFAEGLQQIFIQEGKYTVQLFNSHELSVQNIIKADPTIIIIDDSISTKIGTLIRQLMQKLSNTKYVMFTTDPQYSRIKSLLYLGIHGYLVKSISMDTLSECLEVVSNDQIYIHYKISSYLLRAVRTNGQNNHNLQSKAMHRFHFSHESPLTKRECEIVYLLSEGLSNRAISQELLISETTVKSHVSNIIHKLHVENRLGVVIKALKNGWISFAGESGRGRG